MVSQDAHAGRKEIIAAGLHAARAAALVKKAGTGHKLDLSERRELELVRNTVTAALDATRQVAPTSAQPSVDYRSLTAVVELTILAVEKDIGPPSQEGVEVEQLAGSLEARLCELDAIIAGNSIENRGALLDFMKTLVTLSGREVAGPGETLVGSRSAGRGGGSGDSA